ncbi:MAG TPA: adenylyltransferase/cytidyltransferase family protein [Candidatus Baltobacteraceae bacterium]|jgi:D-glycero-beta-D-manno-heptose 1-phosphate adenylyltransferase|nr:adenylyltransferase/cytidyltransferase family protein [Candidatus Baltobacteraceae bacterium]
MDTRDKILSRSGLHEVIAEHRRASRKIVFANGIFDLLHVGHVRYLQAAKAEGDVLIVGVNSDSSARKLKGKGRPVLTERARAGLVAALAAVDYAVIFDDLNVESLLRELQPDVHAKGTDYTADTVPERDLAALLGIRVAIVGDPKHHSTTALLDRLRRKSDG